MRKNYLLILLAPAILLMASCARDYTSPQFSQKTTEHHLVAIIPFQMVYTGRVDPNLKPDDIRQISEAEAQAFQLSLFNHILRRSGEGKSKIKIEFQTPDRTNRILQDSGIALVDAWKESPSKLAKILGVESVVYTRVEKEKFLTDLESFGITIAGNILNQMRIDGFPIPYGTNPQQYNRTYTIKLDCQLMNGEDESLLWKLPLSYNIDWNTRANDVINNAAKKCSKKFPYRDRSYYR